MTIKLVALVAGTLILNSCGKESKKNDPSIAQQQQQEDNANADSQSNSNTQNQNAQTSQPQNSSTTTVPTFNRPSRDLSKLQKLYTLSGNIDPQSNATVCADASQSSAINVAQGVALTSESDPAQRRYTWCDPTSGQMAFQSPSTTLYGQNGWEKKKVESFAWFALISEDNKNANIIQLYFYESSSSLTPYITCSSVVNSQLQTCGGGYWGGMASSASVGTEIKFSDSLMALGKLYMKKTATGVSLRLVPSNGASADIPIVKIP